MQNIEILDVSEIGITQKLLKCLKDPFLRSALLDRAAVDNEIELKKDSF